MIGCLAVLRRNAREIALGIGLGLLATAPAVRAADAAAAFAWGKVDSALLARTESPKFPGVNLEFDSWQEWLKEESWGHVRTVQVRAKVYTAQGVDDVVLFHAELLAASPLPECVFRIVKRDGRTIAIEGRASVATWRELAAGDVAEFRWSSKRSGEVLLGTRVCQQAFPIREYQLNVRAPGGGVLARWRRIPLIEQSFIAGENARFTAWNLPAYKLPAGENPSAENCGSIELFDAQPGRGWSDLAKHRAMEFETATKLTPELRNKAAELLVGATDEEDKIRRLHEFCRLQLENLQYPDKPGVAFLLKSANRQLAVPAAKTLSAGKGWSQDIDALFGALLQAAGFDPHHAESLPVELFTDDQTNRLRQRYIPAYFVALKRSDGWAFYQPGNRLLPYGIVDSPALRSTAFIAEKNRLVLQDVPKLPPEAGTSVRRCRFILEADGTLHGTVELTRINDAAASVRRQIRRHGIEGYGRTIANAVQARLPGAVASNFEWEDISALDGPTVGRYLVNVPRYALVETGRVKLIPSYIQRNRPALHQEQTGGGLVILEQGWVEEDDIEIVLPENFQPGELSAPRDVEDASGLVSATYVFGYAPNRHTLVYKRRFVFDPRKADGPINRSENPSLQHAFAEVYASDHHAVVLELRPSP